MADKRKKGRDLQCHVRFLCHAIVNFSNGSRLCGTCVICGQVGDHRKGAEELFQIFYLFPCSLHGEKKKLSSVMVLSLHSTSH